MSIVQFSKDIWNNMLFEKIINSECIIHKCFRLYCPGCGGTRAAIALLHLDLVKSLRYNPIVLLLFLDIIFITVLKVKEKIYPEKGKEYRARMISHSLVLLIWFGTSILRDYLLVFHNIDIIGDF